MWNEMFSLRMIRIFKYLTDVGHRKEAYHLRLEERRVRNIAARLKLVTNFYKQLKSYTILVLQSCVLAVVLL